MHTHRWVGGAALFTLSVPLRRSLVSLQQQGVPFMRIRLKWHQRLGPVVAPPLL